LKPSYVRFGRNATSATSATTSAARLARSDQLSRTVWRHATPGVIDQRVRQRRENPIALPA
jgi:hypothetical protein